MRNTRANPRSETPPTILDQEGSFSETFCATSSPALYCPNLSFKLIYPVRSPKSTSASSQPAACSPPASVTTSLFIFPTCVQRMYLSEEPPMTSSSLRTHHDTFTVPTTIFLDYTTINFTDDTISTHFFGPTSNHLSDAPVILSLNYKIHLPHLISDFAFPPSEPKRTIVVPEGTITPFSPPFTGMFLST
ncbi:hypothetical protein BLNAU_20016 [Blattamonas nauphoetae]|uniref:Uncharacterized protein n=1 Tax=Blattamonas nauphoetae TaxID=2049346 RepID=A0ABQ9X344_9EUKA|nr:hypothetical protein BLNAU_20016 [Blattamonas nauphoetae]